MALKNIAYLGLILLVGSSVGFSQSASKIRKEEPPIPVDEIIRKFAEKEQQFKIARANYTYRQDVRVQTLNANDGITGEYRLVSDILFEPTGRRTEKIVYAPQDTLKNISMSPEDLQDLRDIQPFALSTDDVGKYNLKYLGKELVDEIDCYVFDVGPKTMVKGQRYFQGQIWIDDKDLQIVKTYGKAVPDIREKGKNENVFPRFETYREQIDSLYWFPTYTRAVDTLEFTTFRQKIRMIVKYENYKKFQADVKLTFGDAVEGGKVDQAPTTPSDNKAPALDPKLNDRTKKKK
jgi:hypothetical protein